MNFNIYVKKDVGQRITEIAKNSHRSRNSIINEALEEWLNQHTPSKWPDNFLTLNQ